jgi:hypothetical protein
MLPRRPLAGLVGIRYVFWSLTAKEGEEAEFERQWDPVTTSQEDPPSWSCEKPDAEATVALLGVEGGCRAIRAGTQGRRWTITGAVTDVEAAVKAKRGTFK